MNESRIITDPQSGLTYHVKSFRFNLDGLDYDVEKKFGAFVGILVVPREDEPVFNRKIFAERALIRPHRFSHFPLLDNHNTQAPLGYGFLNFITCYYPEVDLLQRWDLQATGCLMPECQKAMEIYARLKEEGKEAIKEISIGYNLMEAEAKWPNGRIKVYEMSIEGL